MILGALGLLLIVAQRLAKDIVYTVFAIGLLMAGGTGVFGWWQTRFVQRDNLLSLAGSAAMLVVSSIRTNSIAINLRDMSFPPLCCCFRRSAVHIKNNAFYGNLQGERGEIPASINTFLSITALYITAQR